MKTLSALCLIFLCLQIYADDFPTISDAHREVLELMAAGNNNYSYQVEQVESLKKSKKRFTYSTMKLQGIHKSDSTPNTILDTEPINMLYHYYAPNSESDGQHPLLVIFTPFIGDKITDHHTAKRFIKRGYHVVIAELSGDIVDKDRPLNDIDGLLMRNTIATKLLIDHMITLDSIDPDRIYGWGVSFGGIRATLVMEFEPRLKKIVTFVAGGDIAGLIAHSSLKHLERFREHKMNLLDCKSDEDFLVTLQNTIKFDPLLFSNQIHPEDVMMISAFKDTYVMIENQKALYNAISNEETGEYPERIRWGVHHVTAALSYIPLMRKIDKFFQEAK